ncbi:hypothetical protein DICPUDRAFT_158638 [Dictyostelium purpureum]|uniref:Uncharacterized protein n=1 Tax=Dictyostelium purpureum TaxID=5786 RepID=F1A243_DICPU|nr:uncharacterized protein DICPUDRAFT_158638 [Dictyostelium purpureum]EGC29738.1 hypothetical protein DICPUDRAFT_158638 [Dictyostelium purpureum]|eukprot:XP_003293731.1 hypothetical protein DICPUDRAFT_158638 [Dictyostelium purpureum]
MKRMVEGKEYLLVSVRKEDMDKIQMLTVQSNAGEDNDVWVPQHYLEDCPMLVRQFEDELAKTVPVENNFLTHQKRLNKQLIIQDKKHFINQYTVINEV